MQKKNAHTILVVDDEPAILEIVEESLNMAGYNTLCASNGHQALDLVKTGNAAVDLLLTDVCMPGITGIDLAKRFVVLFPEIKTLFMSGVISHPDLYSSFLEKKFVLIQKPFELEIMLSIVKKALNTPVEEFFCYYAVANRGKEQLAAAGKNNWERRLTSAEARIPEKILK